MARRQRSEAEHQVATLLRQAREALGLSVSFLTRIQGDTQIMEVVDTSLPVFLSDGARQRRDTTLCKTVLDGDAPEVMPDIRDHPAAMKQPAARFAHFRSYVSVPVTLSDGRLYGTFCAAGLTPERNLSERDAALLKVLASAAAMIIEPGVRERERREAIEHRLVPMMRAGGPRILLQPIVDLGTGLRTGAEALARFPADWRTTPDVVFAEAHDVDLGERLELLALERAAEHLAAIEGHLALNVSPAVLLSRACARFLRRLPLDRVVLELSEHSPVEDYDALRSALAGPRAAGMRLAIDDVGAGFASLRHIVLCAPDVIKLDRSIVDGVSADPVLTTLVEALVAFAHGNGTTVVAEGVETAADVAALRQLRVDEAQGWYFGRPGPADALAPLAPGVPTPRAAARS
ncbi:MULTISPECIES: EAL domain-containing protein [unclassified Actinotalea]|uniref:sensor domain-containing phosphodiesterase n=1 Tax=unclassified Actinotalea TaxID=2638618 RepID=UPI001C714E1D|nr:MULTISPECIES: EAL domain-containing protein [unclassified Actinotalea]